eukprot:3940286-Rhodomonas_salina.4
MLSARVQPHDSCPFESKHALVLLRDERCHLPPCHPTLCVRGVDVCGVQHEGAGVPVSVTVRVCGGAVCASLVAPAWASAVAAALVLGVGAMKSLSLSSSASKATVAAPAIATPSVSALASVETSPATSDAPLSTAMLSCTISSLKLYVRAPMYPLLSSDEPSSPRLWSPSLCSTSWANAVAAPVRCAITLSSRGEGSSRLSICVDSPSCEVGTWHIHSSKLHQQMPASSSLSWSSSPTLPSSSLAAAWLLKYLE